MHVIEFKEDGKARCLHTDELPLETLGRLSMRRASTVEWNEADQKWEVKIDGIIKCLAFSRASALEWEREYFNKILLSKNPDAFLPVNR